jgi:RNA polymerase sigma factor (sigma-70 family)
MITRSRNTATNAKGRSVILPRPQAAAPDRSPAVEPVDDAVLAAQAADGDRAAFEAIYRRHAARIHGLALRLAGDPVEAESLVQDTFVRAWFALDRYQASGSLPGWLARVAVNLWRDRFRADRRSRRLLERAADEAPDLARAGADRDPATASRRPVPVLLAMDLERAMTRLPQGARQVYVLHDVEGYTHVEIADLLGVAVGTAKAQLHRARRLLRLMLTENEEAAHEA